MNRVLAIGCALIAPLAIYLFIEVRAEPDVEVDADKLARAEAAAASRDRVGASYQRPASEATAPAPGRRSPATGDSGEAASLPVAVTGVSASIDTEAPELDDNAPFVDKVAVARKLYGRRRYEQAYELALQLLEEEPNNRRVLRVVIASACIMARPEPAETYYARLKMPKDRRQMQRRCTAYGVELPAP
jgi:hypothetical protein